MSPPPGGKVLCKAKICEVGGGGNFLPLFGDAEQEWDSALRGILYLIGLLWLFMGVAIVSDIFMGAIETITAKRKRIVNPLNGRFTTVKVWNATVANLTLMALGSSAPEILLSVIELLTNNFFSGDLGPSTIVGSAAFNLHCITAVCVAAIPSYEVRRVADVSVFLITASFSILAYLWLYFIVLVSSEDIIEIWEGAVTFILFPLLVSLAFLADKGYFKRPASAEKPGTPRHRASAAEMTEEELAGIKNQIIKQHGSGLSDENLVQLLDTVAPLPKSRAAYRVDATRQMFGGRRVPSTLSNLDARTHRNPSSVVPIDSGSMKIEEDVELPRSTIEFAASDYAVLESVGTFNVIVHRRGDTSTTHLVDYRTVDGTAHAKTDYEESKGSLKFEVDETEKSFSIRIIDDNAYENIEVFYVELSNARGGEDGQASSSSVRVGDTERAKIAIIDDDDPGTLHFQQESLHVQEGVENVIVHAIVKRSGGSRGEVTCQYCTEEDSAVCNLDFEHAEGTLRFSDGQVSAEIELTVLPRGRYESLEEFRLILSECTGGAKFDASKDGGLECQILTIVIEPNPDEKSRLDRVLSRLQFNYDKAKLGHANYKEQFLNAVLVNGGDEEGCGPPSKLDYAMHTVTIFWKVLFAIIPPADYAGGWLCFVVSLIMIGVVTAFIGDLAALLGCVLGIKDPITAITFVALGTSLPDTFASKTAAVQDEHADASIGNITGSNSVNVFLGLGMPWLIGSIYWAIAGRTQSWQEEYWQEEAFPSWNTGGGKFIVIGGDLGFSVGVFSCTAIVCLIILFFRRIFLGGELGGPSIFKWATSFFLVALWLLYVGLSSWKTLSGTEQCD